jgi:hypothetical protein
MDDIRTVLANGGVLIAVCWGVAALLFAVLSSVITNVINNRGKGWPAAVGVGLAFLAFVIPASWLDDLRQQAAMADINAAKAVLDGDWANNGQTCDYAQAFEVKNDGRLIVSAKGFLYFYDITKLPDGKIYAVAKTGGEASQFFREGGLLVNLDADRRRKEYIPCKR